MWKLSSFPLYDRLSDRDKQTAMVRSNLVLSLTENTESKNISDYSLNSALIPYLVQSKNSESKLKVSTLASNSTQTLSLSDQPVLEKD